MDTASLPEYWGRIEKSENGLWVHPDDQELFEKSDHSFNLDFPPPAFVGDIVNAKVIVLTANGGYKPAITPKEFIGHDSEREYVERLKKPASADWSAIAKYYSDVNYSEMICSGILATVNACAYRSPKISKEPKNQRLIKSLPSVQFTSSWLLDCVMSYANRGERLVIAKRYGLWKLPEQLYTNRGIIKDPAPVSPHLSKLTMRSIQEFLT